VCGIGGIFGDPQGLDGSALLAALRHRGPDRQACESPSPGVWLCAARLAISDPTSAGNQPMVAADGQVTIVYNGEIYNAGELRNTLAARGHHFRSRCDTEVILEGFRAFGDRVTDELDGMFAFAIWDATKRRLLLARDALGIKPLWLARPGRRVVFASEVRALLAARAVAPRLSAPAVESFLRAGSVAEPRAILDGVESLPPGHRLTLHEGSELRTRWYSLPSHALDLPASEAQAQVRAALDRAVHRSLEADVPVALLLSGGIDSGVLAVIAGSGAPVQSFHVRIGERSAGRAASLARSRGFLHHELRLDSEDVRSGLPALLAAQDQPSVDGVNSYFIARAIHSAGIKAAITGLGADELFLGYPLHRTYVRARALSRRLRAGAGAIRRVARLAARVRARVAAGAWQLDKLFGVAAASGAGATYSAARALFPDAAVDRLLCAPRSFTSPERMALPDGVSSVGEVSRLDLSSYLVDTLLRDADVMSMAHGVELRVPMLDRRLVETVLALPDALKLVPGRQKPLLVDAVPELPAEVPRAPKEGFELAVEDWLLGALRAPVEATLHDRSACARVGLDPQATHAVWRRFVRRRDRPSAFRVWALYSLCAWAETHGARM
jgi:asparagine synthase (glutamine-hydrolysing)